MTRYTLILLFVVANASAQDGSITPPPPPTGEKVNLPTAKDRYGQGGSRCRTCPRRVVLLELAVPGEPPRLKFRRFWCRQSRSLRFGLRRWRVPLCRSCSPRSISWIERGRRPSPPSPLDVQPAAAKRLPAVNVPDSKSIVNAQPLTSSAGRARERVDAHIGRLVENDPFRRPPRVSDPYE